MRLLTRLGYNWTQRFRLIADTVAGLRCHSCLIDEEAVALDDVGTPVFALPIRRRGAAAGEIARRMPRFCFIYALNK